MDADSLLKLQKIIHEQLRANIHRDRRSLGKIECELRVGRIINIEQDERLARMPMNAGIRQPVILPLRNNIKWVPGVDATTLRVIDDGIHELYAKASPAEAESFVFPHETIERVLYITRGRNLDYPDDRVRTILTPSSMSELKRPLKHVNIMMPLLPFDLRLSFAEEMDLKQPEHITPQTVILVRRRKRVYYHFPGECWRVDLSQVDKFDPATTTFSVPLGPNDRPSSVGHEIEFELVNAQDEDPYTAAESLISTLGTVLRPLLTQV